MLSDLKSKTKLVKRQHMLDAAIRVFNARGYRGATIRDIATEAGVSDGSIYTVFESKEAVLMAVVESLLLASGPKRNPVSTLSDADLHASGLLSGLLEARWSGLTPEIIAMMRIVLSEALINRALGDVYVGRIIEPAVSGLTPLFQRLLDEGTFRPVDMPMTGRILTATFLGLSVLKMLGDSTLDERSESAPALITDLFVNGLLKRDADRSDDAGD